MEEMELYEMLQYCSGQVEKLQKSNDILRETVNAIDDYFEYSNESKQDRKRVQEILSECTKKFQELYT